MDTKQKELAQAVEALIESKKDWSDMSPKWKREALDGVVLTPFFSPQDIRIGYWVKVKPYEDDSLSQGPFHGKVLGVIRDEIAITQDFVPPHLYECHWFLSRVSPIPLTHDVLVANGFKTFPTSKHTYSWHYNFVYSLTLEGNEEEGYRCYIFDSNRGDRLFDYHYIRWVHELQEMIYFNRIKKSIDLQNINCDGKKWK